MPLIKFSPLALLLFVFAVFSGCSNDEEMGPDTENPVVTIISPTDVSEPLHGVVTIKAEAADNGKIVKINVLVDATLLTSVSDSPVEFSWDTKTVTDGLHVIKIVATDGEGNRTEQTLDVQVKNSLFTFTISSGYLANSYEGWIYVSDAAGKTVALQQMNNGTTLTVDYPENHTADSKYSFTRFERSFSTGFNYFYVYSYTDVVSGNYSLKGDGYFQNAKQGTHTLRINNTNNLVEIYAGAFGFDIGYSSLLFDESGFGIDITADVRRSPANPVYYVMYGEAGDALYYQVESALKNTSAEIEQADMSPMKVNVIEYEAGTQLQCLLQINETPGDYRNMAVIYGLVAIANPNRLLIKYPDITFPEYITSITAFSDDGRNTYTKVGEVPTTFKDIGGSLVAFSNSGNSLSVTSTGQFDYISINAEATETIAGTEYNFIMNVLAEGTSNVNVKVPEIPAELLTKFPEVAGHQFVFNSVLFAELSGVESLQDFVDTRYVRNENLYVSSKELRYQTIKLDNSGGRKGGRIGQYAGPYLDLQADLQIKH